MALVPYVDVDDASGVVAELFSEERERYGRPSLFGRMLANQPSVFETRATYAGALVEGGELPARLKELVFVAVSATNNCEYCVSSHSAVLVEQVGLDPADVEAVVNGDDTALDDRERAAVAYARAVASDPKRVCAADVDRLKAAGFDDGDVVEVTLVCASAVAANTFADALNVHVADRALK